MKCPHCQKEIPDDEIARHLAAKGGSAKKNFSAEEIELRRKRLKEASKKRWPEAQKLSVVARQKNSKRGGK